MQAAKAAFNTLTRDNERLRDQKAEAENRAVLLDLEVELMKQDITTVREIITKGGTAADVIQFLDTPEA